MEKEKIRVFLGEKSSYGARGKSELAMKRLTEAFNEDALSRYGLSRDAGTFNDLMRGGQGARKRYQKAVEKELPVKSRVQFVSERAKESVRMALAEFDEFVKGFRSNAGGYYFKPDYICFDEVSDEVVLTPAGIEDIENKEGYYATNEKQLQVYNLAKEIIEKVDSMRELLKGAPLYQRPIGCGDPMAILDVRGNDLEIDVENIMSLK